MGIFCRDENEANTKIEKAIEMLDSGFKSKSAKKDANTYLSHVYEHYRDMYNNSLLDDYPDGSFREEMDDAKRIAFLDEHVRPNELPSGLHHIREKHLKKIRDRDEVLADRILFLSELRESIKIAEIEKFVPKNAKTEYEVKVEKSIMEEMERLNSSYLRAVELGHIFNGIPVSANTHMVINAYGTSFFRTFYYLEGKLTKLNVIIAAAEKVARDKGLI